MPENVNLIFGRNLRQLCEERGTFSDAARELGVSRVQLTRFIKGESFPKPNQLLAMTRLFGVDARIFIEPLDRLRRPSAMASPPPPADDVLESLPGVEPYIRARHALPDGIHLLYRPTFTLRDIYLIAPLLVRSTNRGTFLRAMDAVPLDTRRRDAGAFRRRSYRGVVMATPDGMVMHFYGTGDIPFMTMAHFASSGFYSATGSFRGTLELFRPPQPGEFRRVPVLLHVLPQRPQAVLDAVRRSGLVRLADIPDRFHDYLSLSLAS